jgi:hypothetical protein
MNAMHDNNQERKATLPLNRKGRWVGLRKKAREDFQDKVLCKETIT